MNNREGRRWPSRWPWAMTRALMGALAAAGIAMLWQWHCLESMERIYFKNYVKSGLWTAAGLETGTYYGLWQDTSTGKRIVPERVLDEALDHRGGLAAARIAWTDIETESARLHDDLKGSVYEDLPLSFYFLPPAGIGLAFLMLFLGIAIPMDRKRWKIRREGRQLRGPELLTIYEYNDTPGRGRLRIWNKPSGWRGWRRMSKILGSLDSASWVHYAAALPRDLESSHFLVMGDTGSGKTTLLRQMLHQVSILGESAIVYDPALEYVSEFYRPLRGDIILNPLDERMPYWDLPSEITHPAEATALATALIPCTSRENPFFPQSSRKILAHLLAQRPRCEELVSWLTDEAEIDRRIANTEMATMLDQRAAQQRAGVLASLNMITDALRLLPGERETFDTWSATEWAQERRGWIFLTSTPETRERLRPLTTLWLDTLILRMMNQGRPGPQRVWFFLDEVASLQKLPQLHTALTENRKSDNPVVLGLQGRSQLEARYDRDAETMLSQPAIRIFLRTNEPNAARWISDSIGQVEIERERVTRSKNQTSRVLDREIRDLVSPSQITGLDTLRGYLKIKNLVVKLNLTRFSRRVQHEGFIPRERKPDVKPVPSVPSVEPVNPLAPGILEQQPFFE